MAVSDIMTSPVFPVTALHTTASASNTSTYSDVFTNVLWRGATFFVKRTADGGTATLDVYLQAQNPLTSEWFDVTLAIIAQFADGETGTYLAVVYPGITASDTSLDVIATTSGAKVNQTSAVLPFKWRLRYLSGGTSVTNTFSVAAVMHK